MTKIHCFSNKFSKIAKRWGFPRQASFNLWFWWPKVAWLPQLWYFKLIMTKSNLKNIRYDVISVTSLLLYHRNASPN